MHRVIKTVKVIGVVVPASLLLRADWIIKWFGYVAVWPSADAPVGHCRGSFREQSGH